LEEEDGETHEPRTTEGLDDPNERDDFSSAEISALEALPVGSSSSCLNFELVGVDHHGYAILDTEACLFSVLGGGQFAESILGGFDIALSYVPPWRFGSEENTDEEGNGPHPLDSKGDSVRPLVGSLQERSQNSSGNKLPENPAEIDVSSEVGTECDGADFRGIGSRHGLEDSPRNTLQDITDEEGLKVLCEERDEDESNHHGERGHHSVAVTDSVDNDTSSVETKNFSHESTIREAGLPFRGDLVADFFVDV